MGLQWSREKVNGWENQFKRLLRWHERINGIRNARLQVVPEEHFDDLLAFFQCCFSIRDWLINSKITSSNNINIAFNNNIAIQACRDICNRTKHYNLTDPSIDANWSIGREYVPPNSSFDRPGLTETWFFICGKEKHDIFMIANQCVDFWREYINKIPQNPK